ncbi:MAG: F0F1 ATP synthase subunit B [Armatimonadota bacterium]|nr:F0F1 ATP synthase subunit B [Armatimonadota bacterium]
MEIFEQLGIQPELIAVNIIGFIILLAILKKFLYGPITQMLESRKEDISAAYAAAESEKAKMEELRTDYERRLADIESEARQRMQETVKEAQEIREHLLAEARTNADRILARAESEIGREREKVIEELRREVVDLTINAAARLVDRSLDEPGHRRLVDDFIRSVGVEKS